MEASQGINNPEQSEQEIRDGYLRALGFPPEAKLGGTTAGAGTPELDEIAYEMRAYELGAPLLPGEKDLPFAHTEAAGGFITPQTHGLEFLEDHARHPGPPPVPSKAALDEIRRVGEQWRAEHESASPEPPPTQDLPPTANR